MGHTGKKIFTGLFTAVITPFHQDKSIDYSAFENIIESQIQSGVDGIVVLGSTGESATLSPAEHKEVIKRAVEVVKGRIPVIAGTGSNSTLEAIEYAQDAEKSGVDGLLQIVPYCNKPTQKGMCEHFTAIAQSVNTPIIIYNIPGRTGVNMEANTTICLSHVKNIVGIKEASSNFDQIQKVINETPDGFVVLSGNDDETMKIIQQGGDGVIAVTSNVLPKEMKFFVDSCLSKKWDVVKPLQDTYSSLFKNLFIETNPQPIKTLMAELGKCEEVFRLPLTTMYPENKEKLLQTWQEVQSV